MSAQLVFGSPPPAPVKLTGPGSFLRAFKQRLCLHGHGGKALGSKFRDASNVYHHVLTAGVRVALMDAAKAGLACDIGSRSTSSTSPLQTRETLAVVRGTPPPHVAVAMTLAGFRRNAIHERDGLQWWGWKP